MSKRDQVLQLEPPHELRFKGPFLDVVTSCLKLINQSERRVCFKVKTTAPKRYCVRPNNGIVEPKSSVSVSVMLQPFDYDPNEKNKHKFMVQTMFAPDGDVNQDTLWKDVNPDSLMDSKLRCVFEVPVDGTSQNNLDSSFALSDDSKNQVPKSVDVPSKISLARTSTSDLEHKRLLDELKQMEKENASLRQTNIQLKEEGLRLRRQHADVQSGGSFGGDLSKGGGASLPPFPGAAHLSAGQPPTMIYVLIAVVAVVVGLMLGKIF